MKNKKVKADLILVGVVLAIALVSFLILMSKSDAADYAVVRIDGQEVARYPLAIDGEYSLNNGTNILVIKDKKAYISQADCRDQICVNQGKISFSHQCITCLPNKLTVTIEGSNSDIDIVN